MKNSTVQFLEFIPVFLYMTAQHYSRNCSNNIISATLDFTYLTDDNWKSESYYYVATSGNALRLTGKNGQVVTYEKGIGAHATSTIVYDLTDQKAVYFSSYVGVENQMYNSVGSVGFQVYIDGVKKFDSGIMTAKAEQKYVDVPLLGAKELKLVVTDGGNGQGSDHAT